MAQNDWDDDDDDTSGQESNLVKDLRKQLEKARAAEKELAEKVDALGKAQRSTSLKEVLASKQLNPKLAVFYPADGEATPEAVEAWVKEYADVFGIQPREEQVDEPALDSEQAQLYGRMVQEQGSSIPTAKVADLQARIQAAKTPEELMQLLASN